MKKPLLVLLSHALLALLAGCAVYKPMQCAAPQITDRNQAELTGSWYLNTRVEGVVAYSPVRHLLVRAAFNGVSPNTKPTDSTTYFRGREYELAAGSYWPLGPRWLVGGLGGYGQAQSQARYLNNGGGSVIFFGQNVRHAFEARYNKVFGEAYGTFQASPTVSFGAAYRVTRVNFTTLTDLGMPQSLRGMTRSEPMFFFRTRLGSGPTEDRPLQLQISWGGSSTFGYDPAAPGRSDADFQLKKSRGYLTLGVSLFPHCVVRQLKQNPVVY